MTFTRSLSAAPQPALQPLRTGKALRFHTKRPLLFGDCDPSGIAYFPAYLNMLVGVLEEFFSEIGAPWNELVSKHRIGTPTVRLDLTFEHPGFHGDLLDFELIVRRIGRSSLDLEHRIGAAGKLLWSARHSVVATSLDNHKSIAWPDALRASIETYVETPDA